MTWQQFLTEKMGECWHEWETSPGCIAVCKKCSASTMFPWVKNRTDDEKGSFTVAGIGRSTKAAG
jgi:hypothetical protein